MKTNQPKRVTIYASRSMFGISKTEATLVEHGRRKYAQYDAAPFVKFIPKGKRTVTEALGTFQPFILVVEGWSHPSPEDPFTPAESAGVGVTVSSTRYSSCDPRWETDFDTMIDAYLAASKATVIVDYRHTKGAAATEQAS